jgi:hypothetical protein
MPLSLWRIVMMIDDIASAELPKLNDDYRKRGK